MKIAIIQAEQITGYRIIRTTVMGCIAVVLSDLISVLTQKVNNYLNP
jgi:hypothetical protein